MFDLYEMKPYGYFIGYLNDERGVSFMDTHKILGVDENGLRLLFIKIFNGLYMEPDFPKSSPYNLVYFKSREDGQKALEWVCGRSVMKELTANV